ncbi:hypothetical protein C8Q72DRAFT_741591, partial [Fomitopsis betulina]
QGVNLKDIRVVMQWCLMCDLNTLWQCFGHTARDPTLWAVVVLLIELKYFD